MFSIQFRSDNTELMQSLPDRITKDLQQIGLDADLQVGDLVVETGETTRGDPITLAMVALTAVGAGGALSALLGKDGFLSALARVLEKYVEGRQVEVLIETETGEKIQVSGPVGEIKEILKQIQKD